MKKKYLVTGGSGFIGSSICKSLLRQKKKVIIFDNNSRKIINEFKDIEIKYKKNLKIIKGDIRNKKLLIKSFQNVESVIHLAYINGTETFYKSPELVLDVALKGMINIIECCIEKNVKELFLASSSEVYNQPSKIPTDEKIEIKIPDILNPRFSYSGGKIITEVMGINYGRKFFNRVVIFRPHNVFGPNMGKEHVIPQIINKILKIKKNKTLKIQGSGNETRAFIYIDDFVRAFNVLLKRGKHLNIYNIGRNREIKINSLILDIAKIMGVKINISKSPIKKGSALRRCPNINKIKKLGFKPDKSINYGIENTIKWYKKFYEKNKR